MLLTDNNRTDGIYAVKLEVSGGQDMLTGFHCGFFLSPAEARELAKKLAEHADYFERLKFCSCTERRGSEDECEIHGKARS